MSQWFRCTNDDGTIILVNFERATTMVTVYGMDRDTNRTLIEFEKGHTIKIVEDLELLLPAIGARADRT